jgi:hypothetical protein
MRRAWNRFSALSLLIASDKYSSARAFRRMHHPGGVGTAFPLAVHPSFFVFFRVIRDQYFDEGSVLAGAACDIRQASVRQRTEHRHRKADKCVIDEWPQCRLIRVLPRNNRAGDSPSS